MPLLIRRRSGVVPTAACNQLLPLLESLTRSAEQYAQLSAEICGVEIGAITVGTAYPVYYPWLSEVIVDFGRQYPNIEVEIQEGNSSRLIQELEANRLDFCIISRREGRLQWHTLFEDPMVVWVPSNGPFAKLQSFPNHAFYDAPYIYTYPGEDTDGARFFADMKITPNTCFSSTNSYAVHSMVAAGLGVSVNNNLIGGEWKRSDITMLPLDPPRMVEIGIAIPEKEVISPAARRFADFAQERISGCII